MAWDGMAWDGMDGWKRKVIIIIVIYLNLYIYIYIFCVMLDDGIEFFSLFVVLSTYRDEKEREGEGRRGKRGHCFLWQKLAFCLGTKTGAVFPGNDWVKVALEKYILISNQAIRKSREVNHYLRYATLKSEYQWRYARSNNIHFRRNFFLTYPLFFSETLPLLSWNTNAIAPTKGAESKRLSLPWHGNVQSLKPCSRSKHGAIEAFRGIV